MKKSENMFNSNMFPPEHLQKALVQSLLELGSLIHELPPGSFGIVHLPGVGWRLFDIQTMTEHTVEEYEAKYHVKFQPPVQVTVSEEYPLNAQELYQKLLEMGEFLTCNSDKKRNDFLDNIRITGGRVERVKKQKPSKEFWTL